MIGFPDEHHFPEEERSVSNIFVDENPNNSQETSPGNMAKVYQQIKGSKVNAVRKMKRNSKRETGKGSNSKLRKIHLSLRQRRKDSQGKRPPGSS